MYSSRKDAHASVSPPEEASSRCAPSLKIDAEMQKPRTGAARSCGECAYSIGCVVVGDSRRGRTAVTSRGNIDAQSNDKDDVALSSVSGWESEAALEYDPDSRPRDSTNSLIPPHSRATPMRTGGIPRIRREGPSGVSAARAIRSSGAVER